MLVFCMQLWTETSSLPICGSLYFQALNPLARACDTHTHKCELESDRLKVASCFQMSFESALLKSAGLIEHELR